MHVGMCACVHISIVFDFLCGHLYVSVMCLTYIAPPLFGRCQTH